MNPECIHQYRDHNWFNTEIQERTCLLCGEVKEKEAHVPSPEIEKEIQAILRRGKKTTIPKIPEHLDPVVPPKKGDLWRSPDGIQIFDGENWVPAQIVKEVGLRVTDLDDR